MHNQIKLKDKVEMVYSAMVVQNHGTSHETVDVVGTYHDKSDASEILYSKFKSLVDSNKVANMHWEDNSSFFNASFEITTNDFRKHSGFVLCNPIDNIEKEN